MIYTVGGIKGGTGKTTVATNLAIWLSKHGDVLLVDTDLQGTATDFTNQREETLSASAGYACVKLRGKAVLQEINKLKTKFDNIVIDAGGGSDTTSQRSAMLVSDIYLLPVRNKGFDVWTAELMAEMIEESNALRAEELKAYSFLSQADVRSQDNRDAGDALVDLRGVKFLSDIQLCNRKAYSTAGQKGLSVTELHPIDPKAVKEVTALFSTITNN
jgi:chromosome partitioning protein